MAVFEVVIQQVCATIYTTNVYHVNCTTLDEAIAAGDNIAPIHAAVLPETYIVDAIRVSTPAQHDGIFSSKSVNIQGGRGQAGQNLPQWNRFLVGWNAGPTYQDRKFLGGVMETDQIDGGVMPATSVAITTTYIDPLLELAVLCNKHGVFYVTGNVKPYLVMRQLRRRKKRKTPVI